ncbi:sulfur carrier protein ThiS [Jeotgalibacillus proteolyticus]|uniref:Thiamine biosynthesis protein ThiS n=1 Tax=Jeotgalibacillus proteolyticus TaxID=2082395 RepID=A0A2S5GD55_9BACL|nr:sulfur carrier protein ThiS [Jeotgalibacillus proteolyticus]PPA70972.1 thiamine biosynthesis protein ThiS [Jeotgalibacillus proteolyticus]
MKLIVNEKEVTVPDSVTVVKDLLHHFELTDRVVMVEQNQEVIDHSAHTVQPVKEGDQFQLVQFVGGG